MEVNADDYFTYEGRLASFRTSHKRRGSSAKGKAMKWPHAHLGAESLARAGWFYAPHPNHIDQVICFLCRKGLDGWEEGDDPLLEHLVHAPGCGWAVVAAVEAEVEGYEAQDPKDKRMVEARKGTFGGRWPHEGKKGWKCKTKQLAEAGWKYTPTPESDDMATCAYCHLALDGWEPGDKPLDEHHNRSPDCPFFTYVDPNPSKKPARGRGARASKASRASAQSTRMGTFISEGPSVLDAAAGVDDSVLTTTSKRGRPKKGAVKEALTEDLSTLEAPPAADESVLTTTGKRGRPKKATKEETIEGHSTLDAPAEVDDSVLTTTSKRGRPKKAAPKATKGRMTKAKKEEPEAEEDSDAPREETEELEDLAPPPPKAKRGKKRASDAIEESTLAAAEAPAPKRRATRAKAKSTAPAATTADASVLSVATQDVEMEDAMDAEPAAKVGGAKKGRASSAKAKTRKASGSRLRSTASTASMRSAASELPDDDEIDRQLQADLERPLTDEEDLAADSDSERQRRTRREKAQRGESGDYAMFDPAPAAVDEEVVEAEFMALEEEARRVDEEEKEAEVVEEKLVVPKKGKKAGTARKASAPRKASRAKKAKAEPVPEPELMEPENEPEPEQDELGFAPEVEEEVDAPLAIHEDPEPEPEAQHEHDDSIVSTGTVVIKGQAEEEKAAPTKRGRGRPPKKQSTGRRSSAESQRNDSRAEEARPAAVPRHKTPEPVMPGAWGADAEEEVDSEPELVVMSPGEPRSPVPRALPPIPLSASRRPPPANAASPAMSRHAPSPSQSPQSSDAENQPPSTKQSGGKAGRVVRIQRPATPNTILNSPTKRTVVAGVRSAVDWEPVDIELVLRSPVAGRDVAGRLGAVGPLGSPERRMTVEEWIYHNAGRAESALREECEGLVGRFEAEGVRAMRVLEGLRTE